MTEILKRDATRLWSKNRRGTVVVAVQYIPSGVTEEPVCSGFGQYNPVYVGFDGEMPRELDEVLEENKQLKESALKSIGYEFDRLLSLRKEIDDIFEERVRTSPKKWYQFWK